MPSLNEIAGKVMPFSRERAMSERYDMTIPKTKLGGIFTRDGDREPSPIVSLSIGTAGMKRTALWTKKMSALGCLNRIQSLVTYDCNSTNIRLWQQAIEKSGLEHLSIVPDYLPLSEGFLRQPDSYLEHYGAIERDVERIVDDMERRANEAGAKPQVIIEWLGFGGHARLSYLIHERVSERFPKTKFLPVYCIPAERVLEQNIRDHNLWGEAEAIIGKIPSLITDNRAASSLQTIDERVALGLAAVEACYRFRPESGTMAETVSMFQLNGSRWLSLDITDLPYRITKAKSARPKQHKTHEVRTAHSSVVQSIKEAIWRIAEPTNDEQHTAYFDDPPSDAEQRIYCILPFTEDIVEAIKDDVEDQLLRETFNGPFPGTRVAFAPGDTMWRRGEEQFYYGHICKITGTHQEQVPPTIDRVIRENGEFKSRRRRVLSKGESMMLDMGIALSDIKEAEKPEGNNTGKHTTGLLPNRQQNPQSQEHITNNKFDVTNLGSGEQPLLNISEIEEF